MNYGKYLFSICRFIKNKGNAVLTVDRVQKNKNNPLFGKTSIGPPFRQRLPPTSFIDDEDGIY